MRVPVPMSVRVVTALTKFVTLALTAVEITKALRPDASMWAASDSPSGPHPTPFKNGRSRSDDVRPTLDQPVHCTRASV